MQSKGAASQNRRTLLPLNWGQGDRHFYINLKELWISAAAINHASQLPFWRPFASGLLQSIGNALANEAE
jgi:hypothetical protein